MTEKGPQAFRTISEVAEELDLPQHVLRFWETKFSQIRPMKRSSGRRFYRPEDVELVRAIRDRLYGQGYTIRGVQRLLKERGTRDFVAAGANVPPAVAATHGDGLDAERQQNEMQRDEFLQDEVSGESGERPPEQDRPRVAANLLGELHAIRNEVFACARILEDARRL